MNTRPSAVWVTPSRVWEAVVQLPLSMERARPVSVSYSRTICTPPMTMAPEPSAVQDTPFRSRGVGVEGTISKRYSVTALTVGEMRGSPRASSDMMTRAHNFADRLFFLFGTDVKA